MRQVLLPASGLARLLEQRVVHDGTAARLRDPAEQAILQLGVGPATALDDAGPDLAQDVRKRKQLRLRRAGGRDPRPADVEVVHVPGDREPERASLERLAHEAAHHVELRVGRVALRAVLAHRVQPDGRMADERPDVHAEPLADRAHVVRERFPRPWHACLKHLHRDRFDVRQHAGELLALGCLHGRERERAVADDDRGRAVVAGERAERIPQDLGVVMAVVVDEPRRNDAPVGLDDAPRRSVESTTRNHESGPALSRLLLST